MQTSSHASSSGASPGAQGQLFKSIGDQIELRTVLVSEIERPRFMDRVSKSKASQSIETIGDIGSLLLRELPPEARARVASEDAPRRSGSAYKYEVIDGKRRCSKFFHSGQKFAKARVVPAGVEVSRAQIAAMRLSSNENRGQNLYAESASVETIIEAGGTIQAIHAELGIDIPKLRSLYRVAKLEEGVRLALLRDQIAPTTAKRIANLSGTKRGRAVEAVESLDGTERLTASDLKEITSAADTETLEQMDESLFDEPVAASAAEAEDAAEAESAAVGQPTAGGVASDQRVGGGASALADYRENRRRLQEGREKESEQAGADGEADGEAGGGGGAPSTPPPSPAEERERLAKQQFKDAAQAAMRDAGFSVRQLRALLTESYQEMRESENDA